MFARVMVLEFAAHSRADAWDDVTARLEVRLVVLVAATIRMKILASLGTVKCKLELRGVRLAVHGRKTIARGRFFGGVGHFVG